MQISKPGAQEGQVRVLGLCAKGGGRLELGCAHMLMYMRACVCVHVGAGQESTLTGAGTAKRFGLIKGGGLKNQTRVRLGAVESHAALCPQMGPKGSI